MALCIISEGCKPVAPAGQRFPKVNRRFLLIGGPPKWGDREIDRLVQNTIENGLYRDLC